MILQTEKHDAQDIPVYMIQSKASAVVHATLQASNRQALTVREAQYTTIAIGEKFLQ